MKLKRWIALTLSLSMLLSLMSLQVYASDSVQQDIIYSNTCNTLLLSDEEAEYFEQFSVTLPTSISDDSESIGFVENILSVSSVIDIKEIGDITYTLYESSDIPYYLPNCSQIEEIVKAEDSVNITYQTTDNLTVILTYTDEGLTNQLIYDNSSDILYQPLIGGGTKLENFRFGSSYTFSEEAMEMIREAIASGNYSEIQDNPEIHISVDEEGEVSIVPNTNELMSTRSGVIGFDNEADLLTSLKSDFPYYYEKANSSGTVYCAYLNKYISFQGLDNRNGYVRESASYSSFAASTAITVLSLYLGVEITVMATILNVMGISILIKDGISVVGEAIKLYNSAIYEYYYERFGLLYDSTRFNDYVELYSSRGFGQFTGGYDSNDEFTWVKSLPSTPEAKNWSDIQSTCMTYYNVELNTYGYCERYYPLGWFDI